MTPQQETSEPHVCLTIPPKHHDGQARPEWFRPADFQTVGAFAAAVEEKLGKLPAPCEGRWAVFTTCGFGENRLGHEEPLRRIWRMAMAISAAFIAAECTGAEEVHELAKNPRWPEHWRTVLTRYQGVFDLGDYASERVSLRPDRHVLGPYLDYIDWERLERDMETDGRIVVAIADRERHVFAEF